MRDLFILANSEGPDEVLYSICSSLFDKVLIQAIYITEWEPILWGQSIIDF